MINSINKEILNEDESVERLELPHLNPGIKMPTNYIKEYFEVKTLTTIPHINIALFYQKIHTIRSIFITEITNPREFLMKQYSIKMSINITDTIIHSSRQIIQKIESLNKSAFAYQEQTDYNKTRRIYFGEMAFGKKEGYGVYAEYQILPQKQNGSHFYFYQGFFSQNYKNGLGIEWNQNRIFIGQFINNTHFSHTEAIFLYNNGDTYVGSIFNYKRNGRGVLFRSKPKDNQYYKYETSQRYSQYQSIVAGNWEEDQISRKNKFSLTSNFKEIFSMSLYDYQSNLIIKATSVYVGDIKHIKRGEEDHYSREEFIREGKGFEHFSNGDIYKGEYINDKPHGYGHYIWSNKDEYHGEFLKGSRQGSGRWKGQNGQEFEGQYHNDKRSGYGIYRWPNGNVYEGEFKKDNRNGVGKMTWSNGEIYIGKWKNGLQHGEGEVRASLYSFPIKKQLIFEEGKATKYFSTRKPKQLKISPKRRISNTTERAEKNVVMKKMGSLDDMKTKNKFIVEEVNILHTSFLKPNNRVRVSIKQTSEQKSIQRLGSSQKQGNIFEMTKLERKKANHKSFKKEMIKEKIKKTKQMDNSLGETLLKPIKWANFKQSWEKSIP